MAAFESVHPDLANGPTTIIGPRMPHDTLPGIGLTCLMGPTVVVAPGHDGAQFGRSSPLRRSSRLLRWPTTD